MINKEKITRIHELKPPNLDNMTEEQLADYENDLNAFVKVFPEFEAVIKGNLKIRDYMQLGKTLKNLCLFLDKIYADYIVDECGRHIETLSDTKHETVEAYIIYFLTAVSMLSIDIQVAMREETFITSIADETGKPDDGSDKNILAVDDVSVFLTNLTNMLQGTRYKLKCLNSGNAAMRYLANHAPDMFILDIEMPGMDGFELAENIRSAGIMSPIIFLTGNTEANYIGKAFDNGAADLLTKPITKKYLLDRIEKYI